MVPPLASTKAPVLSVSAPVKALYVPEELRSGQFFGNRTAIDGYKRLVGTLAELVDAVSYVFFARSAGTIDEYRHIGR